MTPNSTHYSMKRIISMMNSRTHTRKRISGLTTRWNWVPVVIGCWLSIGFSQASGQSLLDEAGALKGLGGLYIMGGDVGGELITSGLDKEQVLARVSSRLSTGGIRVLEEMEWLMVESAPVLFVDIQTDEEIYVVRLEILYLVHPVSDPSSTSYAVIWGDGRAGLIDEDSAEAVLKDLDMLTSVLTDDFRANQ